MERSNTHPYENTPYAFNEDEEFNEECRICSNLMWEEGGLTELEYDEYEGRDEGYDSDGDWVCPRCRDCAEEEEEPNTCENPICTRRATRQFNDYYEQVVVCDACGADLDEKYSAAVAASDTLSVIEWEV